jgi:hypothetical protein
MLVKRYLYYEVDYVFLFHSTKDFVFAKTAKYYVIELETKRGTTTPSTVVFFGSSLSRLKLQPDLYDVSVLGTSVRLIAERQLRSLTKANEVVICHLYCSIQAKANEQIQ